MDEHVADTKAEDKQTTGFDVKENETVSEDSNRRGRLDAGAHFEQTIPQDIDINEKA